MAIHPQTTSLFRFFFFLNQYKNLKWPKVIQNVTYILSMQSKDALK